MVNRDTRTLFLHNPKAAGLSVAYWLEHIHGYVPAVPNPDAKVSTDNDLIWLHAWEPPPEFASFRAWCVVREPLARWGSFWNYTFQQQHQPCGCNFEEFTVNCIDWLPTQMNYVRRCCQAVRMEQLAAGLAMMNFTYPELLPALNVSGGTVPWTKALRLFVMDAFKDDFKHLGY